RPLFDDFYDLTAARLDNHGQIVHDRIAVTRPHVILAGHRVKRYVSGQHRAESHTARVPDRWTGLAYHVFAKLRPLLSAPVAAAAPMVPPKIAPRGLPAHSPAATPSSAPRTVPCACAA